MDKVDGFTLNSPKPGDNILFKGIWMACAGGLDVADAFGAAVEAGLKKPPPLIAGAFACRDATLDRWLAG